MLRNWRIYFCLLILTQEITSKLSEHNIATLILARGGSRGVRLKNLAQVGGKSLLSRILEAARLAGLHDVTVSTDHLLIALEAMKNGGRVFCRSRVTASDAAPSLWGVAEFLKSRKDVTVVVLLQATSPFTRAADILAAVDRFHQQPALDCIFSVIRSFKLRWKKSAGSLEPLNFRPEKRPRRQDWDGELVETGAFYIVRRHLVEQGFLQNNNCSAVEVAARDSLEVDTYEDLRLANLMLGAVYSAP